MRTLETIIRLSTANAKLRFSKQVELSDVDVAIMMLKEAIFQEHLEKKPENEEMDEDEAPSPKKPTNLRQR